MDEFQNSAEARFVRFLHEQLSAWYAVETGAEPKLLTTTDPTKFQFVHDVVPFRVTIGVDIYDGRI